MSFGAFVIEGSRPPSVQSCHRPGSARSRTGYHTVAYQSSVDETLFGSYHQSKVDQALSSFKAPWEYPKPKPLGKTFAVSVNKSLKDEEKKKKPKTRPLLWAPDSGSTVHVYKNKKEANNKNSTNTSTNSNNRSSSSLSLSPHNNTTTTSVNCSLPLWNMRDNFRRLKHTPTFVDESLFGNKLDEPSFEAPWNEKPKPKFNLDLRRTHYHRSAASKQRPKTALGTYSTTSSNGSKAVPVWKP